uniref:Common plant regulatory factor 1 n=1 Tax=Petroselinum crispum TaxID=4043 RepID=CPRF1_PETCR|nr:RecName: Full=Common plant regulatory factor 1; Short=CPRF-1 [Petroselinum crispum]AAC49398.1 CPRF1 [Petroselinum crispum]CAA41451.1 light-inducible protein CPRF-1 [Petroselinum crispum]
MGNTDDVKAVKPEKLSSPPPPAAPDQSNSHVYPDWAAMQAYYGPRVALPPYFNPAVASGQSPHPYMWGPPQPVMPPYGVPYAALYAHGGVYAHPGVPLAASPMSMDTHAKSSGTNEHGLIKKLKGHDDLAMSIGNGKADSSEGEMERTLSQSKETEGSSDGSNENSKRAAVNGRKRGRDEAPNMIGEVKIETQSSVIPSPRAKSEKLLGITVATPMVAGKVVGTVVSPSMTSSLELKDSPKEHAVNSPAGGQQPSTMMPNDSWLHNDRDLKRERRKQSNRESARRSRLRKQAEAEELAIKVDSLTAENMALKAEINRLTLTAEKLTNDNSRLLEVMKNAQAERAADVGLGNNNEKKASTLSTANLLSRVDNAGSGDRDEGESDVYEKTTKSGAKLHQLLDANPRTDAVAAG